VPLHIAKVSALCRLKCGMKTRYSFRIVIGFISKRAQCKTKNCWKKADFVFIEKKG
jgi:hypothetical protein